MSADPEMHSWDFTRLDEIVAYANHRGVSTKTAVIELVNAALSHGLGKVPALSNERAMDAIAEIVTSHWMTQTDALSLIADTVRATGRTVENSDDYEGTEK